MRKSPYLLRYTKFRSSGWERSLLRKGATLLHTMPDGSVEVYTAKGIISNRNLVLAATESPKETEEISPSLTANDIAFKMESYFQQYEEALFAVHRISNQQDNKLEYLVSLGDPFDLKTENTLHGLADELSWDHGDVVKIQLQFVPQEYLFDFQEQFKNATVFKAG